MSDTTRFHDPDCGTSRNVLALIRHAGVEPNLIESLKTPPSAAEIRSLPGAMGMTVLQLLPVGKLPPFTKEDGEVVVDDGMRRARS